MEIKNAAKMGNKQVCTILAKQLVQLRKQKERSYAANSKVLCSLFFMNYIKLILIYCEYRSLH